MSYARKQKRQLKRDFKDPKKRTKIVEIHNTKVRKQQKKDKRFEIIVTSFFMLVLIVTIGLKLWKLI